MHMNMALIVMLLITAALCSIVFAVGLGPVSIPASTVTIVLLSKVPYLSDHIAIDWVPLDERIVLTLRLPRVLFCIIFGALLALSCVTMLAIYHLALADPLLYYVHSRAH